MSSYLNPGNLQQDKMFVCHFVDEWDCLVP